MVVPALHAVATLTTVTGLGCPCQHAGLTATELIVGRTLVDRIILKDRPLTFLKIQALRPEIVIFGSRIT